MSRVYATTDSGERFLAYLECDHCDARIKPHPEIASSGWMQTGFDNGPGTEKFRSDYCPDCWAKRGQR